MSADLEVVKEIVKELVKVQQKPVHIAKLSQLYRFKVEHSIKTEHKKGMLDFIKTHMEGTFVLTGEHNDTFVALGNKLSGAKRWIHQTVAEHGPILLSMIGRLYREQTKQDFKEVFNIGLTKFLEQHFKQEFTFEVLKGSELLVDCVEKS
eukprot:CAMPEP_0198214302 /NCGR_PEP_ID=MMETSP1445-20131203/40406_1 /TAXON_ID=36898 /ORGANISM="Pyramimonas sp., Strain CCMP2087" /LENGTH=149 /DNA_ID=CAMNT_0043889435 /DNA_START=164 /DNA_END=610 /DNA_ORIENTATION=+